MDRRSFVKAFFGLAAVAATASALVPTAAEAAPLPVIPPIKPQDEAERTETDYRPDVDGLPTTENAQYYYRRRRFRRRVFGRRRIFRRRFYRPRRRVYYGYRRPIYRRRYRPVFFF
jgi:hypothetical protein